MGGLLGRLTAHDRATETLIGVLMSLTSRGAVHASSKVPDAGDLVLASLGVTVAWGLVDAVLSLMEAKGGRLRYAAFAEAARRGTPTEPQYEGLAGYLDAAGRRAVAPVLARAAAEATDPGTRLDAADWRDAAGVFTIVVLAGLPPVLPFLLIDDIEVAFQVSNAIAGLLLLAVGVSWGRAHRIAPLRSGLAMVALGAFLVVALELLGG